MEPNQFDIEKYNKAKKRVKELKGFYGHLASYVLVIPVSGWNYKINCLVFL